MLFVVCFWWELLRLCFLVVVNEREQVSVIEQMLEGYCMVDTWMSEELYIPEWLKHGR